MLPFSIWVHLLTIKFACWPNGAEIAFGAELEFEFELDERAELADEVDEQVAERPLLSSSWLAELVGGPWARLLAERRAWRAEEPPAALSCGAGSCGSGGRESRSPAAGGTSSRTWWLGDESKMLL